MVFGHGAISDLLSREIRFLPQKPEDVLQYRPHGKCEILVQFPHLIQLSTIPRRVPDCSRKVPEIYGLAVCDEESFAVYALGVEGYGGEDAMSVEEGLRGEEMSIGDIANIGEVEQVLVGADLKLGLAFPVGADDGWQHLDIAFAEDASWSNGAGQKVRRGSVGFEDSCFSIRLR